MTTFPAFASKVTPGSICTKAGLTQLYGGKKYTCIRLGKKLYWENGVPTKSSTQASPMPTKVIPSPTTSVVTPSPMPTIVTPSPTTSAVVSTQIFAPNENCPQSTIGKYAQDSKSRTLRCAKSPFDQYSRWYLEKDLLPLPELENLSYVISGDVAQFSFSRISSEQEVLAYELAVAFQKSSELPRNYYSSYSELEVIARTLTTSTTKIYIDLRKIQSYLEENKVLSKDRTVLVRVRSVSSGSTSPWDIGLYMFPWEVWNDESLKPKPTPSPTPTPTLGTISQFNLNVEKNVLVFSFKNDHPLSNNDSYDVGYAYLKSAAEDPGYLSSYAEPIVVQTLQCSTFRVRIDEILNYLIAKYPKSDEGSLLVQVRARFDSKVGAWGGNYYFTKKTLIAYQNSINGTYLGKLWCG
jgi:hypothetical protein